MILYQTEPKRIGRHEWRLEVRHTPRFDQNSVIPVWRRAGSSGPWLEPCDFCGVWPQGLFQLTIAHCREIAAHL